MTQSEDVHLAGGEPTLHPELSAIVAPAREGAERDAVAALGLDYAHARLGGIDLIHGSEPGRDIFAEPALLFA